MVRKWNGPSLLLQEETSPPQPCEREAGADLRGVRWKEEEEDMCFGWTGA